MKFFRILFRIIGSIVLLLVLIIATMVTTMDHTPYKEMPYYGQWKKIINEAKPDTSGSTGALRVGWAKVNITPASPTPTAGYGNRRGRPYTAVHDSVYIRAMVIDNGVTKAAIVAADAPCSIRSFFDRARAPTSSATREPASAWTSRRPMAAS